MYLQGVEYGTHVLYRRVQADLPAVQEPLARGLLGELGTIVEQLHGLTVRLLKTQPRNFVEAWAQVQAVNLIVEQLPGGVAVLDELRKLVKEPMTAETAEQVFGKLGMVREWVIAAEEAVA